MIIYSNLYLLTYPWSELCDIELVSSVPSNVDMEFLDGAFLGVQTLLK